MLCVLIRHLRNLVSVVFWALLLLLLRLSIPASADIQSANDAIQKKDYVKALSLFQEAASNGDVKAALAVADMYEGGLGVPVDYVQSAAWCRRAAQGGYAPAQSIMGTLYREGRGVPQNYEKAVYWYRMGAEQGWASAEFGLGNLYYFGRGLPKDVEQATQWLLKSAQHGDPEGQLLVGTLYLTGIGVGPRNYYKAYVWTVRSLAHGGEPRKSVTDQMNRIAQFLTPQERTLAEKEALQKP